MTDAIEFAEDPNPVDSGEPALPRQGAPLPLSFTLRNRDGESLLFALGGAQDLILEITNTADGELTIPATTGPPQFALGFGAGTIDLSAPITVQAEDGTPWSIVEPAGPAPDDKDYVLLADAAGRALLPGASLRLFLSGVQAGGTALSHGNVIGLRYGDLRLAGTDGPVSGLATHHFGVIRAYPTDLWRLDDDARKGGATVHTVVQQEIEQLRDVITPPLVAIGGGLVPATTDGARLDVVIAPDPAVRANHRDRTVGFVTGASLAVWSEDADLTASELGFANPGDAWEALPVDQLEGSMVGIVARTAGEFVSDGQSLFLSFAVVAEGDPRRANLRIRCQGITVDGIPTEDFHLSVPLLVGPVGMDGDTVVLTGSLGLGAGGRPGEGATYDNRLFQDDGWNFTLADDDSAFRVGPRSADDAGGMTHFVAHARGVDIGDHVDKATARLQSLDPAKLMDDALAAWQATPNSIIDPAIGGTIGWTVDGVAGTYLTDHNYTNPINDLVSQLGIQTPPTVAQRMMAFHLIYLAQEHLIEPTDVSRAEFLRLARQALTPVAPSQPDTSGTDGSGGSGGAKVADGTYVSVRSGEADVAGLRLEHGSTSSGFALETTARAGLDAAVSRGVSLRHLDSNLDRPDTALFVGESGRVGIGTTSPDAELEVNGRIRAKTLHLKGGGPQESGARLNFGDGEYVYIDEPQDDVLRLHGDKALVLTSNGAVIKPETGTKPSGIHLDASQGVHLIAGGVTIRVDQTGVTLTGPVTIEGDLTVTQSMTSPKWRYSTSFPDTGTTNSANPNSFTYELDVPVGGDFLLLASFEGVTVPAWYVGTMALDWDERRVAEIQVNGYFRDAGSDHLTIASPSTHALLLNVAAGHHKAKVSYWTNGGVMAIANATLSLVEL